jgi:hypothetical protein
LLRALSSTIGILAVAVAGAACGGGQATPGVATGKSATTSGTASVDRGSKATGLLAYAQCMRSHGVADFPDPAGSGGIPKEGVIQAEGAVSNSQVVAAQNACRGLLPAGGSLSGQAVQRVDAEQQQDYLKAAACLRSHGVSGFPDPTFPGGRVNFRLPSSIDPRSAQFIRAERTCQKFIPAGLPYSGSEQ